MSTTPNVTAKITEITNERVSPTGIEGVTSRRRAAAHRMTYQTKRRAESGNDRIGYTPFRSRICQFDVDCEVSNSSHYDSHPQKGKFYFITQTVVLQTKRKPQKAGENQRPKPLYVPAVCGLCG
jgi:hypothetical protein